MNDRFQQASGLPRYELDVPVVETLRTCPFDIAPSALSAAASARGYPRTGPPPFRLARGRARRTTVTTPLEGKKIDSCLSSQRTR